MMTEDPRDALMLGRTIKTTGITVLRAEPSKGRLVGLPYPRVGSELRCTNWGELGMVVVRKLGKWRT